MKRKTDFEPFEVGSIFNEIDGNFDDSRPKYKSVEIKYPSRLNAMALDPSKITSNNNLKYTPGEIIFKVGLYKTVKVALDQNHGEIKISKKTARKPLVKHAVLLMKKALGFSDHIFIDVNNNSEIKHAGLGSSSSLIAAVACAINELFGKPIGRDSLLKYLAQNHGEEIESNANYIYPVQCIGGSAAAGLFEGAMIVLAGENIVVAQMDVLNTYKVVIGIPKDFRSLDAEALMAEEIKSFPKFFDCGKKYGPAIAYRMLHEILPAMKSGDLDMIGDLIYDYRYDMGSIDNCSYCYEKLPKLADRLSFLKKEGYAKILSISSVGPAFFAITENVKECVEVFEKNKMDVIISEIENNPYKVISRKL